MGMWLCMCMCKCVFMHEYVGATGEGVAEKEVTSYLFSSELALGGNGWTDPRFQVQFLGTNLVVFQRYECSLIPLDPKEPWNRIKVDP